MVGFLRARVPSEPLVHRRSRGPPRPPLRDVNDPLE